MTEITGISEICRLETASISKIKGEKEKVDLKDKFEGLIEGLGSLNGKTFYENKIEEKNSYQGINLGDYGYGESFKNDYQLNLIFEEIGAKTNQGDVLTVAKIRETAKGAEDEQPYLEFGGDEDIAVKIDFYAGKKSPSFNTSIVGVSDEVRDSLTEVMSNIPANKWNALLSERVINEKDIILNSKGIYRIADDSLCNLELNQDLLFFIAKDDFKLEGMLTFEDITLGQIAEVLDNSDGKNIYLESSSRKGVYLELKKSEEDEKRVDMALVLDMESLSGRNDKLRFIESDTAKNMLDCFDKCGLKISESVLDCLTEGSLGQKVNTKFSERYGNGYADLSRLVSSCIRHQNREAIIKTLFENYSEEGLERMKAEINGLNEPAKLTLEMIIDLLDPTRNDKQKDFVYEKDMERSMRAGSCKDAECYYQMAKQERVFGIDENFFYQERHPSPTAITRRPIVVDGVRLPKGFLCRVGDKGIEPLRATMFCFGKEEAVDAFGKQAEEVFENRDFYNFWKINEKDWLF